MAEERKDLLTRLADAGEEAIQRISDVPGAGKLADTLNGLRNRVDDLQRRVRGVEDLEGRLASLEKRVASLEGRKRAGGPRRPTRSAAEGTSARTGAPRPRPGPRTTGGTSEEPGST